MNRKPLAILAILAAACGGTPQPRAVSFPEVLNSDWHLNTSEAIAAETVPGLVRTLGLEQARRAVYDGPEALTVVVYEMGAEAAAFELQQKWQPGPGRLTFYSGPRFVLLESPTLDHPSLAALGQSLEKHWQAAKSASSSRGSV
ncbi:MAG: hypothetical protein GY953_36035 [bacterium]|nr:hypothetical protein [bacterium]